jgi:hypothetical protein
MNLSRLPVSDHMTPDPIVVEPEESLTRALIRALVDALREATAARS